MIIQKLLAGALTATLAVGGMGVVLKTFEENKLDVIKNNYVQVEKVLKENESKLVDKYNQLYIDADNSIKTLEHEKAQLKAQRDKLQLELDKLEKTKVSQEVKPVEELSNIDNNTNVNTDTNNDIIVTEEIESTPNIEESQTVDIEEVTTIEE